MTAATIDPQTASEAGAITAAREMLVRAVQFTPRNGGAEIARVLSDLAEAIELYGLIWGGELHPGAEWPDLEHDGDAFDTGLRRAAGDVTAWAGELAGVIGKHCGAEAAEYVSTGTERAA